MREVTILTKIIIAIVLLFVIPFQTYAQISIDPFGIALEVNEVIETEVEIINEHDYDISFDIDYMLIDDEENRLVGPRRDDFGDIIEEFDINGNMWTGLAWDGDLMWGSDYEGRSLVGVDQNGEVQEEINVNRSYIGLCWDGEAFWGCSDAENSLIRFDMEGDVLESIRIQQELPFGVAWDGEMLWYSANSEEERGLIARIDMDGRIQRTLSTDQLENPWLLSIAWVPEHVNAELWAICCEGGRLYQLNPEDDRPEIVQETNTGQQTVYGIEHDKENLWFTTPRENWFVMDDGNSEFKLLTVDPEVGEIPSNSSDFVFLSLDPTECEEGVYNVLLTFEFLEVDEERRDDMEESIIEMTLAVSVGRQTADITGNVTSSIDDDPISNVWINLDEYYISRYSNNGGNYGFSQLPLGNYRLTFTVENFLPLTEEVILDEAGEVRLNVSLLQSHCNPSTEIIEEQLVRGESTEVGFSVNNDGNGPLAYSVERRLVVEANVEPWEIRESIPIGEITGDSRIEGVAFDGDNYFVSGSNRTNDGDGPNLIYVLNRNGEIIREFEQAGNSQYGMKDLAWDGELLWGSGDEDIYGFDREGEVQSQFEGETGSHQAIAWDPDREIIWACGITSNSIYGYQNGQLVSELERNGLRVYGLSYYSDDPDGYPLYINSKDSDGKSLLYKVNPDEGDTLFVTELFPEDGYVTSAEITNQLDIYNWLIVNIVNNAGDDLIDVRQVAARKDWMQIQPVQGIINADESQDFRLTLDASKLVQAEYNGVLAFLHDGLGSETQIRINLFVSDDNNPDPPTPFSLMMPENESSLDSDTVDFQWGHSEDPDIGEEVTYKLWIQSSIDSVFFDIVDTTATLILSELENFTFEYDETLTWWVIAISGEDEVECNNRFTFKVNPSDNPVNDCDVPVKFGIYDVSPNPFNSSAVIQFVIERSGRTDLAIYNLRGQKVSQLVNDVKDIGAYTVRFNAGQLASGTYILNLKSGNQSTQKKMVLIR